MKAGEYVIVFLLVLFSFPVVQAQDVELELQMPSESFSPGEFFRLDLHILNNGPNYIDSQLFVALNIGTDDYWFYPSWCHYPDEIDYEIVSVFKREDFLKNIVPEFEWPRDAGEFDGAVFLSVLVYEGDIISNLAQTTFGWTEEPYATPTPKPMFVYIPPGSFQMGTPDDEMCRRDNEGPVHTVTITHGFYIQATEVTQRQWTEVIEHNPSYNKICAECPVEIVTWYDCCIFCNRLSIAEGLEPCYYSDASFTTVFDGMLPVLEGTVYWKQDANGYRLPTEAEWEYACRAGTTTAYNSGQDNTDCADDPNLDPLGWYYSNSDTGTEFRTHPVGMKQPNDWGLYDMHGNVWEWCWDWYDSHYYDTSPSTDPTGPETGSYRVARSGTCINSAMFCRSGNRNSEIPGYFSKDHGFRLVRSEQ